jgi:hypothetical protein
MEANSITITLNQGSNKNKFVWLTLQTDEDTRQCCYQRYAKNRFFWVGGDNEPEMTHELKRLWEKSGDDYINACIATGESQLVTQDSHAD